MNIRVVKVGGSLLDQGDLPVRLGGWLSRQRPATSVLIAGGGPVVDSVRDIDSLHRLGETAAHWLCVRAMSITARLLVELVGDTALVDELHGLRELLAARPSRTCVFDAARFLAQEEPSLPGVVLPQGWHVTSDSIAARVAQVAGASELVLLKSRLPGSPRLRAMAEEGYVDEFFATIAEQLPLVRLVNLRDDHFAEILVETASGR